MTSKLILDPLWITKGKYLDPEYFNYVLLDASAKYRERIKKGDLDNFYEVLFHVLNMNSLAVKGNLFTAKLKEVWANDRISQIQEQLKVLYETKTETSEIFKNANYVFLNIILEYLREMMTLLDSVKVAIANKSIHTKKEIFIIVNSKTSERYSIWRLVEDHSKNLGYSFKKITTVNLDATIGRTLMQVVTELNIPELANLANGDNVCLIHIGDNSNPTKVAKAIRDMFILNKGIAKEVAFEPKIIQELYRHLWFQKILPFTLDEWAFAND